MGGKNQIKELLALKMYPFTLKRVVSSGSGIGRLMSVKFAKLGCRLVLWDINKAGNEETAALCRKAGTTARCYEINLCNREEIYKVADQVLLNFV